MSLTALLVILMLGVEIFRPMRELRTVLHQGMVGMSAAQGIYQILDGRPVVTDAPPAPLEAALEPNIAFEAVRFRYPGTRRTVHDGLEFRIAPGERIGIVGGSGGGKSSIVRLLLRFYDPEAGAIRLGGRDLRALSFAQIRSMISVVNQDTFLFHGTVEENIRLGNPEAGESEVEAAAKAANIHEFILTLPQGYRTVVGEKGVKLSGGQRQRVAIARALLRDTPILVLDEALSAVDAENEAVIQEALDRLMRGRTTLVLAHRLSSVIDCDRILVLDQGRVVEKGRHEELMRTGGVYARLMAEQARRSMAPGPMDIIASVSAAEAVSDARDGAVKPVTEGIIKAEGLNWIGLVIALMKVIMPWRGRLAATFGLGVLRVLAFIGVGVLSALAVLALKHGTPYAGWLWALAVVAPLSGVLHWIESWIAHDMAFRLLAEMRIDVFRKLDALAPAYLVRRRTGDLLSLVTRDIELIEFFFAHTVAPAFVAILVPAVVLGVLASASPWIALTLLPFLLAVGAEPVPDAQAGRSAGLGGAGSRGRARRLRGRLRAGTGRDRGLPAGGRPRPQARGAVGALYPAAPAVLQRAHPAAHAARAVHGAGRARGGGDGRRAGPAGAIDAAVLPLLTLLAMAAFLPVSEIAQIGRQLADTLGATRRVYALAYEPVPVMDGPGVPVRAGAASLALERVRFIYPGQSRSALAGISIEIPAGKTVALVGPSGAGKTTTAHLLMRFWDPDQGRIALNGVDLREYALDDLRRQIALVAQETYLFNDTLRSNILIAQPDASESDLLAAVEHASLGDLVATLPQGLESKVGERGTNLSGGQRQRIAIARAFLKDAPVLILDEATSHLDALNEQAVRRALDRLKADRTTIVIAHRLSTVRDADLIVVLDGGRIVDSGTHEALLAKGGLYAQLVSRQLASAYAPAAQ